MNPATDMTPAQKKQAAAKAALEHVEDGMRLGIGTGSTAEAFVEELAKAVAGGLSIIGVPTSERTAELCKRLSVPLTTLNETPELDLTIDGADEIDPQLRLIKGGGAALLREKITAYASARMIVIADDSKLVDHLGAFALPIEVNPFGLGATMKALETVCRDAGCKGDIAVRHDARGAVVMTDGGHLIVDASFGHIADPEALSSALLDVPGVVQHGLFLGIATMAILAGNSGISIHRATQAHQIDRPRPD